MEGDENAEVDYSISSMNIATGNSPFNKVVVKDEPPDYEETQAIEKELVEAEPPGLFAEDQSSIMRQVVKIEESSDQDDDDTYDQELTPRTDSTTLENTIQENEEEEDEEIDVKPVLNKRIRKGPPKKRANTRTKSKPREAVDYVCKDGYPYPYRAPVTYAPMTREEIAEMDFSACPLSDWDQDNRNMYKIDAVIDVLRPYQADGEKGVSECLVRWAPSCHSGPLKTPMLKHFDRKMVVDKLLCSQTAYDEALTLRAFRGVMKEQGEVKFKVLPKKEERTLPNSLQNGITVSYETAIQTRTEELIQFFAEKLWGPGETHEHFNQYETREERLFDDTDIFTGYGLDANIPEFANHQPCTPDVAEDDSFVEELKAMGISLPENDEHVSKKTDQSRKKKKVRDKKIVELDKEIPQDVISNEEKIVLAKAEEPIVKTEPVDDYDEN